MAVGGRRALLPFAAEVCAAQRVCRVERSPARSCTQHGSIRTLNLSLRVPNLRSPLSMRRCVATATTVCNDAEASASWSVTETGSSVRGVTGGSPTALVVAWRTSNVVGRGSRTRSVGLRGSHQRRRPSRPAGRPRLRLGLRDGRYVQGTPTRLRRLQPTPSTACYTPTSTTWTGGN